MISRILVLLVLAGAAGALAEDAKAKAAREELEKQLSQMVGKQPTKVRLDFVSFDDPNYRLEEAGFELDGRVLGGPSLSQLSADGTHLVWNGDVSPGKHMVKVRLVFSNGASVVLSDEGGYKWKVGGEVSFDVNSGIEVRVQVTPKRDATQKDIAKRFKLALPAQPVMIAQLDDGKMPDAMPRFVIAVADAGASPEVLAALAADEKKKAAESAAEAKKLAADEKKKAAESAAEAKKLAAEERKQKAAEALEAKKLAAAQKKQEAAEALEAKKLAAAEEAEARRLALEAKAHPQPVVAVDPADAGVALVVAAVVAVDAGAPEESPDAGVVAVAVAPLTVPDAGPAAPVVTAVVPSAEDGPPWLLIGGAGAVAALVFIVLVARRRARPPSLDE